MKTFFTSFGLVGALLLTSNIADSQQSSEYWGDNDIFGKPRIFLVCTPNIDDPMERILPAMDWQGFEERDLVIVTMGVGRVEILNADGTRDLPSSDVLTQIQQGNNCNRGADFNLIGKDGGVKKLWSDAVGIEDLFATIDAMPMRRYEMRQEKRQNQ